MYSNLYPLFCFGFGRALTCGKLLEDLRVKLQKLLKHPPFPKAFSFFRETWTRSLRNDVSFLSDWRMLGIANTASMVGQCIQGMKYIEPFVYHRVVF